MATTNPTPLTTLYTLACALGPSARVSIDPPEGPDARISCAVSVNGRWVATACAETVDGAVDACLRELRWYARLQAALARRDAETASGKDAEWHAARAARIEEVAA